MEKNQRLAFHAYEFIAYTHIAAGIIETYKNNKESLVLDSVFKGVLNSFNKSLDAIRNLVECQSYMQKDLPLLAEMVNHAIEEGERVADWIGENH